jgi:hypothetical protein
VSIQRWIDRGKPVAVFTRNHLMHLEEAAALSRRDAQRQIVFRARSKWISAARALDRAETLPVYIALVGRKSSIEYAAELVDIQLNPSRSNSKTKRLLRLTTRSTQGEGLWEKKSGRQVRTLYAIRNCRKVRPLPLKTLVKVADNQPLNSKFRYSYAIVAVPERSPVGGGRRPTRGIWTPPSTE